MTYVKSLKAVLSHYHKVTSTVLAVIVVVVVTVIFIVVVIIDGTWIAHRNIIESAMTLGNFDRFLKS